jgi:hypothetical protein
MGEIRFERKREICEPDVDLASASEKISGKLVGAREVVSFCPAGPG